jgi:hypothetical protein
VRLVAAAEEYAIAGAHDLGDLLTLSGASVITGALEGGFGCNADRDRHADHAMACKKFGVVATVGFVVLG